MKTAELTGAALDWAVAKCEGNEIVIRKGYLWVPKTCYSTDWSQGGPIIEREEITIDYRDSETQARKWTNADFVEVRAGKRQGLIAAMRCYVASKMGNTVEIPEQIK